MHDTSRDRWDITEVFNRYAAAQDRGEAVRIATVK